MKPILMDFPKKMFETERLYVRSCMPGDGKVVQEAIAASQKELAPWLPFAVDLQSADEVEEGIRRAYAQFILREDFRLHIYLKENDLFIGSTGLHRIDWDKRKFEIGYWCDSRHHKKGYITEAVRALANFCFAAFGANRVEIRCNSENTGSRRVAEKAGFILEGILKKEGLAMDGKTHTDTCVFSLLSPE